MINKKDLFCQLSSKQKSTLIHSVKLYVKKNFENSDDLISKFLEEETYYLNIGASRLHFIENLLKDKNFLRDLKLYFNECINYYNYQKSLEPFKQAQKEFAKEQRKKNQEFKMSKEAPTKRQISYYKSLCKKYDIELKNEKELSKLDLRNLISEIKNEHQTD